MEYIVIEFGEEITRRHAELAEGSPSCLNHSMCIRDKGVVEQKQQQPYVHVIVFMLIVFHWVSLTSANDDVR